MVSQIEIQDENLEAVKLGMLKLTTEGSVSSAFKDVPVQVGAKTGSAQVSAQTNSNAVFVCFAPYDDPQIAVAIAVEHGGPGGPEKPGVLRFSGHLWPGPGGDHRHRHGHRAGQDRRSDRHRLLLRPGGAGRDHPGEYPGPVNFPRSQPPGGFEI